MLAEEDRPEMSRRHIETASGVKYRQPRMEETMTFKHMTSGAIFGLAAFAVNVAPAHAFGDEVVGIPQGGVCKAITYFDFSKIAATFSFSYDVSADQKNCVDQHQCKKAMKIACQGAKEAQCEKDKTAQCEKECEALVEQKDQKKKADQICKLLGHGGLLGQEQPPDNKCAESIDLDLKTYGVSTKGAPKGGSKSTGTATLQWAFCYGK